ncbi:MAG TPA: restriction endonuclease subunit S [Patescibacteria group bacterium]|nr:restriction endonuclease subunit S [Patescibacteria group bacterium]
MAGDLINGEIPDHWEFTTLGDICQRGGGNIQTGPFGSQLHASDYVPVGVPSIMPTNIGENRIVEDGIVRITEEDANRLGQHRLRAGDIIYSRRGDVEKRALIREREEGWFCGTGCLKVRLGSGVVDPLFTSLFLGHPAIREWIVRHAVGATMPNLNTTIMSAVPFALPPLAEQKAIAAGLGALDDKIELNRRMNATLEAMARALFQSWFVDFDPVRAKLDCRLPAALDPVTAALFPDLFQDSEIGPIPSGWTAGKLGDIGTNSRRGVQPSDIAPNTPYIALEHMPRRCIALGNWDDSADVASSKSSFKKGEILFGKLRPYFHKVGVAPFDGVCSTDILVLAPKSPEWFGFLLGHASSDELIQFTDLASTGTKMPRTNWSDVSSFKVTLPPKPISAAFTRIIQPMADLIHANLHQSRTLATLRDTLLPKLLSGELSVDRQISSQAR